jgi:DNA-binding NarL/FixJ family response regulator
MVGQNTLESIRLTMLVVDDHEAVLNGTVNALERQYPDATIYTAPTAQEAHAQVRRQQPDLTVLDLSIPEASGEVANTTAGLQLLRTLMQEHTTLNIVVQSAHVKSLIRLKPTINSHEGGFTVADKSASMQEMLTKVDWALQGLMFTPKEMRTGLEVKPEWLDVLNLAFQKGLQDRAIAQSMNLSERTVRNYWTKVQDALGVYPDEGINMRIQTEIRAREEGLID